MSKSIILAFLLVLFAVTAHAQEDGSATTRCEHGKINTEDPSIVGLRDTEVESSFGYAWADRAWSGDRLEHRDFTRESEKSFKITHGFFDNFDAAIEAGYLAVKDKDDDPQKGRGFTDIALTGRYRFITNETLAFEAAYIGGLTLPAGAQSNGKISISQRYWTFDQKLAAVKDWGMWTANADVGFSLPFGKHTDGERGTAAADVAVGYQVFPWLQPEVEANYAYTMNADGDSEVVALTAGAVMPISEAWCANTGVQRAIAGRNADRTTTISVAIKRAF